MITLEEQARSIFLAALERDAAEWPAVLDGACGDCAELRERVARLLQAHQALGSIHVRRPESPGATVDEFAAGARVGMLVGAYKLLEPIGEGGFGVVFMAEQSQPLRRKVALKVLKPGMDTKQVVARFEAERQALALMDHPNIAHVFDGGTTPAGRPYFVMELVRGVPITQFCDEARLGVRERLALFVDVCSAVQHAHHKGIIHRDLKPSNILVTMHDDRPVVKVIDFGVAKAIGQQLTERTLFTGFAQMIGTPMYMSPEQAQMSGLDVDTRSDVYSLGVLLYELLTGTTPFDGERLRTVGYDEMRRIIREEEPPRPSARLSTLGEAATVSARRGSDPKHLRQVVRGELDWIVMKALEKDRNRRYESASAFAADVRRYLADEAVQACPPSIGYRLRKFAQRHRGPVLVAMLVVLTLVGGIVGTTVGMLRADAARADAADEAGKKQIALADAEEQLFTALVQRARAERNSGRVGQRFETLKLVRQAARTRVTSELRTIATAALILPDVEVAHEWEPCPESSLNTITFDADFVRYARFDKQGGIVVCQRTDDREEILARHRVQGDPVFRAGMSPDGHYLAYTQCRSFKELHVCRLDGGRMEERFVVREGMQTSPMGALAYRPNGRQLAIGHPNGWVSVYDLERGERVRHVEIGVPPWHLAFHPIDGRLAVAAGNVVRLFDVDTGKELPALRHTSPVGRIETLAWHPDGVRMAAACHDCKIYLWDTRSASVVMTLVDGHEGNGVAFHPNGELLLSNNYGDQTRVWDVATGRLLLKTSGNLGPSFSRDGKLIGVGSNGTKARLSRLADGRELRVIRRRNAGSLERLWWPVLHPDGRTLAACDYHWLSFFDVTSGEDLGSFPLPRLGAASPVFFDPLRRPPSQGVGGEDAEQSGGWVTGGRDGLLAWPARFDPARPTVLRVGPARRLVPDSSGGGYSRGASASKDGRVVAVPQGNSTLVLHREKSERRLVLGPQYGVRFSAVSPDGRWVFTGSHWEDGKSTSARIWDAQTGKQVRELPHYSSTNAQFSPDGKWLMTSSADVRLWQVDGWREVRRLSGQGIFSPDSRLLAASDGLSVIRLEETATGREVARLTGPEPMRYHPTCFTPDGTRLIAGDGMNTALYVFDLRLIREGLKELGLDWEWPEFPKALPDESPRVSRVEILPGELVKPQVTREQRARQAIEHNRKRVEANPKDASACNNLAWLYLTAPEAMRDVKAAVPLAEKAVQLAPKNAVAVNTLGVAYYRTKRYREAVAVLRENLERQVDSCLGFDLFFLAMCHQELEEPARARDYYDWAVRWTRTHRGRSASDAEELTEIRAEAEERLGMKKSK